MISLRFHLHSYRVIAPAILAVVAMFIAIPADAQVVMLVPHPAHDGVAVAKPLAQEVLGSDATLTMIGAIGKGIYEADGMEVAMVFDPKKGTATAWVYQFYSASRKERVLIAAIDIPDIGYQAMPTASPVPMPDLTTSLALYLPFAASGAMVTRLAADSVYKSYLADVPNARPATLSYRTLMPEDTLLLSGHLPLDGPVWHLSYSDGSASMNCYVHAATGATYCIRDAAVSSAPEEGGEALKRMSLD